MYYVHGIVIIKVADQNNVWVVVLDLQLVVEPKDIPLDLDYDEDPWDVIKSTDVINENTSQMSTNNHVSPTSSVLQTVRQHLPSGKPESAEEASGTGAIYPYANFNPKINTAGLLNTVGYCNFFRRNNDRLYFSVKNVFFTDGEMGSESQDICRRHDCGFNTTAIVRRRVS